MMPLEPYEHVDRFFRAAQHNARLGPAMVVRIVDVPSGSAPLWVRRAWIGLELPLVSPELQMGMWSRDIKKRPSTIGVILLMLRGRKTERGYWVWSGRAIEILAQSQPEAAAWWRENAPHFLVPEAYFLFSAKSCSQPSARARPAGNIQAPGVEPVGDGPMSGIAA